MAKYIFQYAVRFRQQLWSVLLIGAFFCMNNITNAQQQEKIVRISEIEVYPQYLEAYKTILKQEAEASVRLEAGVVAIFPMFQKDNPTQVRILEIYKDKNAYQSHLKTTHFHAYKTETIHMVKSLKLTDMDVLDLETAEQIFKKLKINNIND